MVRRIEKFLSDNECTSLLDDIAAHASAFRRVEGRRGMGPRYSVIDGELIASCIPAIADLGERLHPLAEEVGGMPLAGFADPRRCMRVQRYDGIEDGFRWHFDGHPLAAIVTLENDSEGMMEVVDARISRVIKPVFYAAYALPQFGSLFPRRSVPMNAGDVILIRGRESLHRGRSRRDGRRTILVFAYDRPGARPARLQSVFARLLNY